MNEPGLSHAAVEFDNGMTLTFDATYARAVTLSSGKAASADYEITGASCN